MATKQKNFNVKDIGDLPVTTWIAIELLTQELTLKSRQDFET
ncbi:MULTISPECIES: hypothetical protein [Vibrio harveyi group]|nr:MULTISPECIES: hypothetical protein [Vibrio harveyi group]MDF4384640.1 hypothetical protein [Vibrio parahaemolyticus]